MTLEELVRLYKSALNSHKGQFSDYIAEKHLAKTFDKLHDLLPGIDTAFVRKSFRNSIRDSARSFKYEQKAMEEYARVRPDAYPVDRDRLDVVLNSLPEDQSTALTCKFIGGLTNAQICAILDISKNEVEGLLQSALNNARDIYEG